MITLVFVDITFLEQALDEEDSFGSPEEIMSSLEDKLDSGEMSVEDVRQYLADYERKQR